VNQILRQYDGPGNLTAEFEEHRGMVTSMAPKVLYQYATDFSNNYSRLSDIVYPDGRKLHYTYGSLSGLNDAISRVDAISDTNTDNTPSITLETYQYLGLGTVLNRSSPQTGIYLNVTLDSFGRVQSQAWKYTNNDVVVDGHTYAYDADGNVLYSQDLKYANRSEL
jgi:hypothetical protein